MFLFVLYSAMAWMLAEIDKESAIGLRVSPLVILGAVVFFKYFLSLYPKEKRLFVFLMFNLLALVIGFAFSFSVMMGLGVLAYIVLIIRLTNAGIMRPSTDAEKGIDPSHPSFFLPEHPWYRKKGLCNED